MPRRRHWSLLAAGRATVVVVPLVATASRDTPHADGTAPRRARPGQRQEPRPHRRRGDATATCPNSHFDLARQVTRPRRPDRVPRVEHGRRPAHRPVPRATDLAAVARAATTRGCSPTRRSTRPRRRTGGRRRSNLDVLFDPTAASRAPTRSGTSCRSASTSRSASRSRVVIGALSRCPRDFEPGQTPGPLRRRGPPGRDDHLLRVGVRLPGPAARARRRPGDRRLDEQPLVPAVRELGPAPRDRPDARRRDGPPGGPGRDLGHHPRSSTPTASCTTAPSCSSARSSRPPSTATTGETPYVRYGEWAIGLCVVVLAVARRDRGSAQPAVPVHRIGALARGRDDPRITGSPSTVAPYRDPPEHDSARARPTTR